MAFDSKRKKLKGRSLLRQVEALKRAKIAAKKVVSLDDYRQLDRSRVMETILVVDDDEVMRNALKRILEGEGYTVILAEDGMSLSKVLESTLMDLILLDVNLPWVDGFELCSLIKSNDVLRRVPLILISASKGEEDIEKGFSVGCDHYIGKPFNVDNLVNVIEKSLNSAPKESG